MIDVEFDFGIDLTRVPLEPEIIARTDRFVDLIAEEITETTREQWPVLSGRSASGLGSRVVGSARDGGYRVVLTDVWDYAVHVLNRWYRPVLVPRLKRLIPGRVEGLLERSFDGFRLDRR